MHSLLRLALVLVGVTEQSPRRLMGRSSFWRTAAASSSARRAARSATRPSCFTTRGRAGSMRRRRPRSGALRIAEYYAELARLNARRDDDEKVRIWLLRPKQPYTAHEVAKMREYLDAQIGRRYSVRNYVRGKPGEAAFGEGRSCGDSGRRRIERQVGRRNPLRRADLDHAQPIGRYKFENCHTINPQALYTAVLPTHAAPDELLLSPLVVKEPWCQRAQRRTAEWFNWCGWSCREAWAWCW